MCEDGRAVDLTPGTLFSISPIPHDSRVVGDEPYVSLHFLGADHDATQQRQRPSGGAVSSVVFPAARGGRHHPIPGIQP